MAGGLEISQWLYTQGADFGALNHWGHGVVNKAAWRGHNNLLAWLFANLGKAVHQPLFLQDFAGFVPIELAEQAGHAGTVELLAQQMATSPGREYTPAITADPVVHQHKLRELGLTDPNAL